MEGYNPYAPPARDPIAPAQVGGPAGAPVPWTISEVLSVGFEAVKLHPMELIGGFFVVTLISQVPVQLPELLSLMGVIVPGTVVFWALQAASLMFALVVGPFLWVGQIRVALAAARRQPFDFGLFFSGGDRLLPMIGVSVLLYLGIVFGVLLLIVPGIILALGWALAGPLVVDANDSPVEALRESWEAMRGHKLQMFLFGLVAALINIAALCACFVGVLVVLPVVVIAYAEIFRRVTGRMN